MPVGIVRSGRQLPEKLVAKAELVVKGNKFRIGRTFNGGCLSDFKIDASKNPCEIDMVGGGTFDRVLLRGLYKLKGDELSLYFSGTPSERPKGINEGEYRDRWDYRRKKGS